LIPGKVEIDSSKASSEFSKRRPYLESCFWGHGFLQNDANFSLSAAPVAGRAQFECAMRLDQQIANCETFFSDIERSETTSRENF